MKTNKIIRDNFNRKKLSSVSQFLLVVLMITLASLSCSLPLGFLQSGTPEENLAEVLAGGGLLNLEEISISEDQVVIEYEQLLEEDSEVMVNSWLASFQAAAEAAPEASEYILKTSSQGEPYLVIRANGLDVRGYAANEISLDLFLEQLVITDFRPLPDRVAGILVDLGLDIIQVSQSGNTLKIEYYPAPSESKTQLMDEWWLIFASLSEQDLSVEMIQIRAVMLDTSVFVVESARTDLEAYISGEITPFQYLARLDFMEEPLVLGED